MVTRARKLPILIVEDDQDDRLLLQVALKPFEDVLDLHVAENGEELMEYLHQMDKKPGFPHPKIILLDIHMPKKDGRQALLEIRSNPKLKHIPIIVWTTSSVEEEKRLCIEAGADRYVTKPDSLIELQAAIRGIVKEWLQLPSSAE